MTTEVDAHDPDDADAVEAAIAIAVAEALAHPPDPRNISAHQVEAILESAVGSTLKFYSQRVLQGFAMTWANQAPRRAESDSVYDPIEPAVELAIRRAIDDTGESVRDIIRLAEEKARAPRASVLEQGRGDPDVEAFNRLRIGMDSVSRVLTTRTREEAKEAYAVAVGAAGAVWRTRRDGRVRNSHGDLEGEFVHLGDPFRTVTGFPIRRPGDPQAPLRETINCRCRLSYRMPT